MPSKAGVYAAEHGPDGRCEVLVELLVGFALQIPEERYDVAVYDPCNISSQSSARQHQVSGRGELVSVRLVPVTANPRFTQQALLWRFGSDFRAFSWDDVDFEAAIKAWEQTSINHLADLEWKCGKRTSL